MFINHLTPGNREVLKTTHPLVQEYYVWLHENVPPNLDDEVKKIKEVFDKINIGEEIVNKFICYTSNSPYTGLQDEFLYMDKCVKELLFLNKINTILSEVL